MPREAKSSPAFHAVRPATLPLHSFCQTRFPILRASALEIWIGEAAQLVSLRQSESRPATRAKAARCCWVDEGGLSTSVATFCAVPDSSATTIRNFISYNFPSPLL